MRVSKRARWALVIVAALALVLAAIENIDAQGQKAFAARCHEP